MAVLRMCQGVYNSIFLQGPYLVLCLLLDTLFDGKPISRFYFLETGNQYNGSILRLLIFDSQLLECRTSRTLRCYTPTKPWDGGDDLPRPNESILRR